MVRSCDEDAKENDGEEVGKRPQGVPRKMGGADRKKCKYFTYVDSLCHNMFVFIDLVHHADARIPDPAPGAVHPAAHVQTLGTGAHALKLGGISYCN
uniref:Uncharacterized protein n=1 Tax=Timema cristinae TaxID=61476 RepID=A0A7R9CDZ8_TIMCR|nr:unnamed protein product [Timema cristinae]